MFFYNIAIIFLSIGVKIGSIFSSKLKLFVNGRAHIFKELKNRKSGDYIWLHCASLGEFILAEPLLKQIKSETDYKICVTFFSPSGYEARKNTELADLVVYMPLDFYSNAQAFVTELKPVIAIFSKYDFWIHHIQVLAEKKIPIVAISSYFYPEQIYFKSFAGFYRKALQKFDHFFVINESSKSLLSQININKVTVSGDTRFDKVFETSKLAYTNAVIEEFVEDEKVLVVGSAWEQDIAVMAPLINKKNFHYKVIIAPHEVGKENITKLLTYFKKDVVLYTDAANKCLHCHDILIIDTIGILSKIYKYATVAYVGGAFKQGLHNILEPLAFGKPVLCGNNLNKFPEALIAKEKEVLFPVQNADEFEKELLDLFKHENKLDICKEKSYKLTKDNLGATQKIWDYLSIKLTTKFQA
ncbi:MAG: glycosyltransferase N-terminal domain-containing protein [Cytophagales bacterium]